MTYSQAEGRVQSLQKSLKKHINKSRLYFEQKARFNQILDDQKKQVQVIEETIVMTKEGYADSLKELEKISEEIHQRRATRQKRKHLGLREKGVGSESTTPISQRKSTDCSQLCDHDGDETDGFRLNITQSEGESSITSVSGETGNQNSLNSSSENSSNPAITSSSPPFNKTPADQKLQDLPSTPSKSAVTSTPIRLVKSGKMDFLTIRKLSDDEMSEADSIASTEQLDDVQIEQLMLESEGFDTLQDVKTLEDPAKSPLKVVAPAK